MPRVAREAGPARRRLTSVPMAARAERLSLLALGRRHLVRARHTRHGCSVVDLVVEPGQSGLWLVALARGARLSELPVDEAASVQVMQGRVRVYRDGRGPAVLPGDLVLGPVPLTELVSLTDAVLVVTGTPYPHRRVPA
jgi:hypothetical protein